MAEIIRPYYTTDWTLGEMWDFTTHRYMEPIVRFIEPKIVRGMYLPCWKWQGRFQVFNKGKDNEYAYPTVSLPIDINHPKSPRKVFYVHRFLAEQFWRFEPGEVVYRTCNHVDCVNPAHFAISYRNDPQYN